MSLTLKLVYEDLRRLKWVLLLWLAVLLGQAAFDVLCAYLAAEPSEAVSKMQSLGLFIYPLRLLAAVAIVGAIVLGDPLVGTTAFWYTRPISGMRLFAAKGLLLFALLVALPAAVHYGLIHILGLAHTYSMADFGGTILGQLVLVVPLFFVASLTSRLGRYAVLVMLLAGSGLLIVMLEALGIIHLGLFVPRPVTVDALLTHLRAVAAAKVVLAGAMLLVVLHQYTTRITVRSWLLAFGVLVLCNIVLRLDLSGNTKPDSDANAVQAAASWAGRGEAIRMRDAPEGTVQLNITSHGAEPSEPAIAYYLALAFSDVSSGLRGGAVFPAVETIANAELRFEDGTKLPSLPFPVGLQGIDDARAEQAAADVLAATVLKKRPSPSYVRVPAFIAARKDAETYQGASGRYSAQLDIGAFGFDRASRMPIRAEASALSRASVFKIKEISSNTNRLRLTVIERRKASEELLEEGTALAAERYLDLRGQLRRFVLHHPGRKEILFPSSKHRELRTYLLSADVTLERVELSFDGADVLEIPFTQWLVGAELVSLDPTPRGRSSLPVVVENVPLD